MVERITDLILTKFERVNFTSRRLEVKVVGWALKVRLRTLWTLNRLIYHVLWRVPSIYCDAMRGLPDRRVHLKGNLNDVGCFAYRLHASTPA